MPIARSNTMRINTGASVNRFRRGFFPLPLGQGAYFLLAPLPLIIAFPRDRTVKPDGDLHVQRSTEAQPERSLRC